MNNYFYLDSNNKQHGPISVDKFEANRITPSTLVWCNGMDNWYPADTVPELKEWCAQHTPAPAGQQPGQPGGYGNSYGANYGQQPQQQGYDPNYGQQPQQPNYGNGMSPFGPYAPCPPTYLVWAILATLCCCLPFGIVAIIKSSKVTSYYNRGLYDQALIASSEAKNWCIYSLVGGIIWSMVYSAFYLFTN